ncbi:MAG TPA: hypothetical protein VMV10_05560 [Pirellulales bacterium]|nr:hypothetical protein [Pirellulales bacterium]
MLLTVSPRQGLADDPKAADKPNDGAEAILQSHLDALKVSVAGAANDATLQVAPQALLKYNDPARRYLAACVWRIGKLGRPKGLVVLELWPHGADARRGELHHELSSFHPGGLALTGAAGVAWRPRKSVLEFKPLDDAPLPARTAERRLLQMKQLARGFAIKESFQEDVSMLRLLPRPIDRYEDRKAGIDDGAMFAFTYGTNPELVLLLECQGKEWQFALARLGGAELNVKRGDKTLQVFPELVATAPNDAYTAQTITVLLPQPK